MYLRISLLLPPAIWGKVIFLHLFVILSWGGCAWLLLGGVRGCSGGWGCVVAPEGMRDCSGGGTCMVAPGGCMVALGGMCGCSWGGVHAWLLPGGHAWLLWGGVHGCSGGCMVALGGMCGCSGGAYMRGCSQGGMCGCSEGRVHGIRRDMEIRSMSGRYASYWNVSLYLLVSTQFGNGRRTKEGVTFHECQKFQCCICWSSSKLQSTYYFFEFDNLKFFSEIHDSLDAERTGAAIFC